MTFNVNSTNPLGKYGEYLIRVPDDGRREFCDICGEEKKSNNWQHILTPMDITLYVSSMNPLGKYDKYKAAKVHFDNSCDKCRRVIAEHITSALDERTALRKANAHGEKIKI